MPRTYSILLLLFLSVSSTVLAQNLEEGEKIAPDRPGFGDAVSVVPKFGVHIETGTSYEKERFPPFFTQEALGINSTLLRFGVLKKTELRFDCNLWKISQTNTNTDQLGLSPCRLGLKYHLVYNKGIIPAITFIGMQELQFTATRNLRSERNNTDVQLSFANKLDQRFAICYNLGSILNYSGNDPLSYYAIAFEIHLSDKLGYYLQGHGSIRYSSRMMDHRQNCETGFMLYPNHNTQIDISGGVKLRETFQGTAITMRNHSWFFFSAGFSWRFSVKKGVKQELNN